MKITYSAECPICEEWHYITLQNSNLDPHLKCPECGFILHFRPDEIKIEKGNKNE